MDKLYRKYLSEKKTQSNEFREKAENSVKRDSIAISSLSSEQIKELIYELKVHQIELEMQNENLQVTRDQLLQTGEQYADLYNNAPVGYLSSDEFGLISRANNTLAKMLNTDIENITGTNLNKWCREPDAFYLHCRKLVKQDGGSFRSELRLKPSCNTSLFVSIDSRLIKNEETEAAEVRSILTDITEIKELERNLRHAEKFETIGTLAGGIAHDFNNILGIILGNNDLISIDLPEWSPLLKYTEEIRVAVLRARDIVRQLLTFSRKDDDKKIPLNIGEVIRESIKLIRSTIPANIDIDLSISDNTGTVLGNATQINQVLINLCSNAKDALSPYGGTIKINLSQSTVGDEGVKKYPSLMPGKYTLLTVSDNGCGIEKEILDKIFNPYFTTKEIGKGTGIGLAVTHGIVENHNGAIYVESSPGNGAAFNILFPVSDIRAVKKAEENVILPDGNERILFIDDEEAIMKLGKRLLEKMGYKVTATTDPVDALRQFRDAPQSFDIIITDMAMPKITGDKLATEILETRPGMPIILCTGHNENISKTKAARLGICEFAEKPFGRAYLAKTIRKVLDSPGGTSGRQKTGA